MSRILPIDFCLLTDQEQRIPATAAAPVIRALLEGRLKVRYAAVFGRFRQWLELRADGPKGRYTIVWGFKDGAVQSLWVVLSPSVSVQTARCYCIDREGPVELKHLPVETLRQLSEKLVPADWREQWNRRYHPKKPKPKKKGE